MKMTNHTCKPIFLHSHIFVSVVRYDDLLVTNQYLMLNHDLVEDIDEYSFDD